MKKALIAVVGVGVIIAVTAFTLIGDNSTEIEYFTGEVTEGTIENIVAATGRVEAVLTVQVGSQVTGQVQTLYADYNSIVAAGQLLAKLDPRTFEAALENSRASLVSARSRVRTAAADLANARASLDSALANLESVQVDAETSQVQFRRSQDMREAELISDTDLENARATAESAQARLVQAEASVTQAEAQIASREAGIEQADASVVQAEANVERAELDLDYTSIYSPVDGVVISREVDVGQTVSASTSAPTLFNIANDLAQMRVNTSVDEADIGKLAQSNDVNFTVDAYPGERFQGRIEEIRLNPSSSQNVVTYSVIVAVDNQNMKMKPGMTANIIVTTARLDNVLTVPNGALRYNPANAEQAMGQLMTSGMGGMTGMGGMSGMGDREPRGYSGEGASARMRTAPARIEARGSAGSAPGQFWDPGEKLQFATPPEIRARPGVVWVLNSQGIPEPRMLMLGITDGARTEVLSGEVAVGELILIGDSAVLEDDGRSSPQFNPFGGRMMGGRMGGGGGGGH